MRRIAKPFTIEVKKRGMRKRDAGEATRIETPKVFASEPIVGRDMRFRDAESLFRANYSESAPADDTTPAVDDSPGTGPTPMSASASEAARRRILPDLVAEAAASEAALAVMPEPRRRGRPPKTRTDEPLPKPAKRQRSFVFEMDDESSSTPEFEDTVAPALPAVLFLAASARRRAARATDNLPRSQRWKRRLPKVCW